MSYRTARRLTCLLAFFLAGPCSTFAGVVGLSWDASAGASGYRVYFSDTAGGYSKGNLQDLLYDGPATSVTIDNLDLTDCLPDPWHFAVTAYNVAGESDFSGDVASWPRPRVQSASPAAAIQGSEFTLTVSGANFESFEIDHPNVVPGEAGVFVSCDTIQVFLTVEPMAEGVNPARVGDVSITVTNLNGLSTTAQAFEVLIDPARFDINKSIPTTVDRLDGMDTIRIATRHATQLGDAGYDPDFDFDGDGWVDGNELSYIGSNFGLCWDVSSASWKLSACDSEEEPE